jgi:predicted RecB family endonuclease
VTPSARALTDLRKEGWTPWVVEATIRHFKRDLFNCIDILAIRDGTTLAVQVTAGSAHANRATKVRSSEYLPLMLGAGWRVEVWSYRKAANGRYVRRVEQILTA